jgi:very-short-patch-repair endonuclease|tara:strand:- start:42445 stop:43386 length:942 start_codon:yes stop_codon:yes gene_type:complete
VKSKIKCLICEGYLKTLTNTHLKKHNINFLDYIKRFPNSKTISIDTKERRSISMLGKKHSENTKKKLSKIHKGKKLSEYTKRKISLFQKGKKLSEEHIQKLKDYQRIYGNQFKGKKHSEESRKKISEAGKGRLPWNKGKSCPNKTRKKISKKLIGRKLSLNTRKKMSISRIGRIMSESTRKKLSIAKKGRKVTLEHKNKIIESLNKSPNKFEERCIDLFKKYDLPLKFVGDFNDKNFFIAGKVPDFVSTNNKKLIVEVFYDYFKIRQYGSIKNYKRNRRRIFSKYGWKTLFLDYKDVQSNFDKFLREVKKELE